MSLRFVIARFQHETNTFSPITTPLESFYPQWGADALINQTGLPFDLLRHQLPIAGRRTPMEL